MSMSQTLPANKGLLAQSTTGKKKSTSSQSSSSQSSSGDVEFRIYGAAGGYRLAGGGTAGYGGYTNYIATIASGTVITAYVGATGTNASADRSGSGGGGGSAISIAGTVIAVAGGGGGGGYGASNDATFGAGGGTTGGNGGIQAGEIATGGGYGGTQSAAGAGGVGSRRNGTAGSGINGGNGSGATQNYNAGGWGYGIGGAGAYDAGDAGAGGGGGGYYGGGGGGGFTGGDGGGGGSGFTKTASLPAGVTYISSNMTTGQNSGTGLITIYIGGLLVATLNPTGSTQTYTVTFAAPTTSYVSLTFVSGIQSVNFTNNGTTSVDFYKTGGSGTWDTHAYCATPFTAPCTIEFNKLAAATDNGLSYAMIGWNTDPTTDASYTSLDYASYPFQTNQYQVYNNGSQVFASGTWNTASKFYIVYGTDGTIKHYNGATLLYNVAYGSGQTVYIDSGLYGTDATYAGFTNVRAINQAWNGTAYV